MQDRPTAQELLRTIGDLLQGEVLRATEGALQHQVRVAGNLCRILERELALGTELDAGEVELLAGLLGINHKRAFQPGLTTANDLCHQGPMQR